MGQRGPSWNDADDKALLELVKGGKSWITIGVKLSRTSVGVRQRYNKLIAPARRIAKKQARDQNFS